MSGSKLNASTRRRYRTAWLAAFCIGSVALSSAALADDDRRHGEKRRGERHSWSDERDDHWRHEHRREHRSEHRRHRAHRDHRARGWRYHDGRYWAPASYRGRHCTDRRHYHGVHYHVRARDYYDYYYPRYRFLGPRPVGANASVIITLPLF